MDPDEEEPGVVACVCMALAIVAGMLYFLAKSIYG
jgi:hypothetical protein